MTLLPAPEPAQRTPPTNRGVYPQPEGWSAPAFDYYRATVPGHYMDLFTAIAGAFPEAPISMDHGLPVANYEHHKLVLDRLGRHLCDLFWGGANGRPNVQAKGANAAVIAALLRTSGIEHFPSRADTQRTGARQGLYVELCEFSARFAAQHGLAFRDIDNHHVNKGNTFYIGSRKSTVFIRGYQPGLKRAEEEQRTGEQISELERNAVRIELECKPDKPHAKLVVAQLSAEQLWGASPWAADYASEVFAMSVEPISLSQRRESNRDRALRFMAQQYGAHLASLFDECQGDRAKFGSMILGLAGLLDTPEETSRAAWELRAAGTRH